MVSLLNDDTVDPIPSSYISTMLALTGSSDAKNALIIRLPVEKAELVRKWIANNLVVYFNDQETCNCIIRQINREQIVGMRSHMTRLLIDLSNNEDAVATLVSLLDDPIASIRYYATVGVGAVKATNAVPSLIKRLDIEKEEDIIQALLRSLGEIQDSRAISKLVEVLEKGLLPDRVLQMLLWSLGQTTSPNDESAIQAILKTICHKELFVRISAVEAFRKITTDDAIGGIRRFVMFGLQMPDLYC